MLSATEASRSGERDPSLALRMTSGKVLTWPIERDHRVNGSAIILWIKSSNRTTIFSTGHPQPENR